jgi:hypothetical protein
MDAIITVARARRFFHTQTCLPAGRVMEVIYITEKGKWKWRRLQ